MPCVSTGGHRCTNTAHSFPLFGRMTALVRRFRSSIDAVRHSLRAAGKTAVTAGERVVHPIRRNATIARVRQMRLPARILFICEGNIYRSPFGAGILMAKLPERVRAECLVGSAGFTGPGRPSPGDAISLASELGVDLTDHRSSLVHAAMISEWDVFVVMNGTQARHLNARYTISANRIVVLGDLDPLPIERRAIPDPWEDPAQVLPHCYARVVRCVETMAEVLTANWDTRSVMVAVTAAAVRFGNR